MSRIVLVNTVGRFLRDRNARLAPVPHRGAKRRREVEHWLNKEERREAALPLLLTGAIAALYVIFRIGLTYVVI